MIGRRSFLKAIAQATAGLAGMLAIPKPEVATPSKPGGLRDVAQSVGGQMRVLIEPRPDVWLDVSGLVTRVDFSAQHPNNFALASLAKPDMELQLWLAVDEAAWSAERPA